MKELTLKTLLLIFIISIFTACKDVDDSTPQTWEDNPIAVADKERIEEEERIREEYEELSTTTDNSTGLMWQDNDHESKYVWADANSYCSELTLVDYSDWRLPTRAELLELYERRGILSSYLSTQRSSYYWTSSSSSTYINQKILVDFYDGTPYRDDRTDDNCVRCVRVK
jgi:hypothetical protein